MVKSGSRPAARDKRRYACSPGPTGCSEKAALTSRFPKRKTEEYEALDQELEALQGEIGLGTCMATRSKG
jgi:hypothetical protein